MATCSSADSVLDAASQIKSNATKLNTFVNGTASQTVQLGTGDPTPTLRKFVADAQDVVTQAALDAGQTVLDDVAQNMADIAALQSGKADKVANATSGHFAGLNASGNLTDSGRSPADITALEEAVGNLEDRKADKLSSAENGNVAMLDGRGNLGDSRKSPFDFRLLLASAGDIALAVTQSIKAAISACDDAQAMHRLQNRLLDGTNPDPSSKPVLFVLSGQSNAVGNGDYVPFDRAVDCGSFWAWYEGVAGDGDIWPDKISAAPELRPIADPIGNRKTRGSGWPAFAKLFFALTGRRVILLSLGNGGAAVTDNGSTTANTWANNGYGTLRASRQAVWNGFASAVPASSYDLGAILWIQGESDASRINAGTVTVQDYKTATLDVLDWTRALIGDADCPVFMAKIGCSSDALESSSLMSAYQKVQAAQEDLCDGESIFMASSMAPWFALPIGYGWERYMSDSIHYSHEGYAIQGKMFARCVARNLDF